MNSLDKQYRIWAENKSDENLNLLLKRITNHFRGDLDEGSHIAQEVCFKVWEKLEQFVPKKEDSFKAWVNTLARLERKTLLLYRTRELNRREFLVDDPEDSVDGLTATEKLENILHTQAAYEYDAIAREQGLIGARTEMLLLHKDPFIRQYAEGVLDEKTDKQIAEEIGITKHALECKLSKERQKFAKSESF